MKDHHNGALNPKAHFRMEIIEEQVARADCGVAVTSGRPGFDPGCDYLGFAATRHASAEAFRMAGIADPVREIDFVEVRDCFTWTEIPNQEELGFFGRGEGMHFIAEGRCALAGDLPVNPAAG